MNTTYVISAVNVPVAANTAPSAQLTPTDHAGVPKRGCTSASFLKKRPSRAIAKKTRVQVSVELIEALNIETTITSAISLAAQGPTTASTASAATRGDFATASGPSACRYARLASRYRNTSAAVPSTIPRGNVRCGSRASPAENVSHCQPSYAHSTPIIAPPALASRPPLTLSGQSRPGPASPNINSTTPSSTSAPLLTSVATFCTSALVRVPTTFSAATTAISASENALFPSSESVTSWPT